MEYTFVPMSKEIKVMFKIFSRIDKEFNQFQIVINFMAITKMETRVALDNIHVKIKYFMMGNLLEGIGMVKVI